jgi:peptide chain release factor 1
MIAVDNKPDTIQSVKGAVTTKHLEIRPGEGGDDALAFATELAASFTAYARRNDVPVDAESGRTIVLTLTGRGVDGLGLWRFCGTHRIQRIPTNDKAGRRHTSTATVALLDHNDATATELSDDDIRIDTYRGHGKGGQHRNKTSSAVRLTHLPTGLIVVVERGRSQAKNIESAKSEMCDRLREIATTEFVQTTGAVRNAQILSGERPVKQWTWNDQRGEVMNHTTGATYSMRDFQRGRLDI